MAAAVAQSVTSAITMITIRSPRTSIPHPRSWPRWQARRQLRNKIRAHKFRIHQKGMSLSLILSYLITIYISMLEGNIAELDQLLNHFHRQTDRQPSMLFVFVKK
jgi:hypothetical protein